MSDIIPNLENMTDAEKKAALDAIQVSIAKSKEVQKQRIGENVGLVIDALKKIESDIQSRYDLVGNTLEKRVATIKDGKDGKDGRDGRNGRDGLNGKQGVQGIKGEDGRDGRDGVDGVDGISVTSARIDFDGSLVISLSSGIELNVGEVVAPDLAESIKVITNGGGTSQSVLDTLASLQTQITNLIPSQTGNSGKFLTTNGTTTSWATVSGGGGLSYQGTWNATTNTPTLASSTGTNGYYYIVATAGSTNLDGITDWQIGDWLLFNGTIWQKIDQSNLVTSVAGRTGAVTLANTDISGLGTMSTQNASSVAITGGTINGTTIGATTATTGAFTTVTASTSLTTPIVQATNSAGLALRNSAGTTQISMGAGGGDNVAVNVSTNLNGTNAQIDISPTGTGHVHIKPTGVNSIEIAPTYVGDIDNMIIGAVTPKNGSFVDLSVTGTTSFDGSQGTAGQVLTSAGTGATPTWTTISSSPTAISNGTSNVTVNSSGGTITAATNGTTAVTIDTSQNVLIPGLVRSSGNGFQSGNATDSFAKFNYDGGNAALNITNEYNSGGAGSTYGQIVFKNYNSSGGSLTERVRITGSGNLLAQKCMSVGGATPSSDGFGITFPATQSASSDANTLDDYEEGTWTPTLPNGGTLSNVASFYTKIGRTVYIQLHLNSIAPTNNGSEFQIGSLPFSSTSTGGSFGGGCFQYCGNTNLSNFLPIITNNGNYFFFHQNSGTTATITNSTYVGLAGATKSMIVNAWYITN
jgi:hypothetical protein